MLRAVAVTLAAVLATALAAGPARAGDDEPAAELKSAKIEPSADLKAAIVDSLKLLAIEHVTRITFQAKTRRALGGDFWTDYRRSVRWPGQWQDTDSWQVNYIGHPMQGAAAGYIWLEHDPKSTRDEFGRSIAYWSSRWRSVAWSAAYSVQFEVGPLSEASIGNVGMNPDTTGWVDYVVTPVGAFGFMIAEDALDRYFIRWFESHVENRALRAAIRLVFGPSRFLANSAENKLPWYR